MISAEALCGDDREAVRRWSRSGTIDGFRRSVSTTGSTRTILFAWSTRSLMGLISRCQVHGVEPAVTGRPAFHPSVRLKLYIYGYLNRVPTALR